MIKMSLFLTRRSDLTFEAFSDYWMNVHWPIVQTVPAVEENTIRYVQQHSIGGVPEGVTAAPFDGYAEAWFPNMEATKLGTDDPTVQAGMLNVAVKTWWVPFHD